MQRKILIIDDHDDLATSLDEAFDQAGHDVRLAASRDGALPIENIEGYVLVITDLDVDRPCDPSAHGNGASCLPNLVEVDGAEHVKAFKLCAASFRRDEFNEDQ